MFRQSRAPVVGAMLCLLFVVPGARGEEAAATQNPDALVATPALQNPFGATTKLVDTAALAKQRGGTDAGPLSDMKLNGVVSDNHASNLVTGSNVITDGSLSNASGVPMVVQNSGNNVLIQNATIINVQVK